MKKQQVFVLFSYMCLIATKMQGSEKNHHLRFYITKQTERDKWLKIYVLIYCENIATCQEPKRYCSELRVPLWDVACCMSTCPHYCYNLGQN